METNRNKNRVLIVDDEKIITMQISRVLANRGYDVIGTASGGIEAVEKALKLHPDIIFMDIIMPHGDGLNAIKKIKRFDPDVKIIVITGLHDENIAYEALDAGAMNFLFKPFSVTELFNVIDKKFK
jgi:YesN/AraC family two-component response regulator